MLTGGMTSASEVLSLTQPAISRLIRDLEIALDLTLFERRGNQLVPTAHALALASEVERSFVGLERIKEYAQSLKMQSAGSLRVACLPALSAGTLPRFVAGFLRERPGLHAHVMGMPSHAVIEAVASGQADVGYAAAPVDRPGLLVDTESAPAVAIVPQHHRLAVERMIDPAHFAGERFIGLDAGSLMRAQVDAAFGNLPRETTIETPLSHIACLLVAEGAGVSIVDPCSASEYVGRGLVVKPLTIRVEAGYVCLRPKHKQTSALVLSFIAGFSAYLKRLMKELTS
jgi:DNA-binding transcriptional LysR family regulator